MTLAQAKQRQGAFLEAHGARLLAAVRNALSRRGLSEWRPIVLVVNRDTFEAIEDAFQHWPVRDEDGQEFVGNACFCDATRAYPNVLLKGIPVTYWGAMK